MVYPDQSPAPKEIEVVDLEKEEEMSEQLKPAEEEPGTGDSVETRVASKELDLPGQGKQLETAVREEDKEMEADEVDDEG